MAFSNLSNKSPASAPATVAGALLSALLLTARHGRFGVQNQVRYLPVGDAERRALEENIINARTRRHEVDLVDAFADRLRPVALLPDAGREEGEHAHVFQ